MYFLTLFLFVISIIIVLVVIGIYSFNLPKPDEYPVGGTQKDYEGKVNMSNGNLNNESNETVYRFYVLLYIES